MISFKYKGTTIKIRKIGKALDFYTAQRHSFKSLYTLATYEKDLKDKNLYEYQVTGFNWEPIYATSFKEAKKKVKSVYRTNLSFAGRFV